ncbi:MAG: hypothetical protein ACFFCW_01940 [Candidatus Hodarchaeota archaeon]
MKEKRKQLFSKYFAAYYMRVRMSYDIDNNPDLFNLIRQQYYDLTESLPLEHIVPFLNSLNDFHNPDKYVEFLSHYKISKGLSKPEPQEEPESNPAERAFGIGTVRIMMQQFQKPMYEGDKELLRAMLMADYYRLWKKDIPDWCSRKMKSVDKDEFAKAYEYFESYKLHRPFKTIKEGVGVRTVGGEEITLPKPEDFKGGRR